MTTYTYNIWQKDGVEYFCDDIETPETIKARFIDKSITDVVLDEDTKIIEVQGFSETNIRSIIMPNKLKKIETEAFYYCPQLSNIEFNEGLEFIGNYAFWGCDGIINLILPNSVLNIGEGAFMKCHNLKDAVLSDNLQEIGFSLFFGCENLEKVIIGKNTKVIYQAAFAECTKLKNVVFSEGLKEIQWRTFENCNSLEEITIPNSVEIIEDPFTDCKNLKAIYISKETLNKNPAFEKEYRNKIIVKEDMDLDRLVNMGKTFKEINKLKKTFENFSEKEKDRLSYNMNPLF